MTNQIIEVEDVSFSYEKIRILKNVSFNVNKGDFICITGCNGVGKTTLLNIILGLNKGYTGVVKLFGENIKYVTDFSKLGYMPQNVLKLTHGFPASVREVILMNMPYKKFGFSKDYRKKTSQKISKALDMVSMGGLQKRLISDLSAGQQQRVMLARVLVNKPELLILDEPTTGVDSGTCRNFYKLLSQLNRLEDITVLMVTHDLEKVVTYTNRFICLDPECTCTENEMLNGGIHK